MFHQLLTPVGGNLVLSFLVAALPIATVLVVLGVLRRPAWQASLAGLVVGLVIAMLVWKFPVGTGARQRRGGRVFALWPVMWIVFNALLLYNIAVISGRFDAFRDWVLDASAERPARRAGGDRLLLRLPAGGHRGLRHAGGDHQRAADPGRPAAAGGADLHADLQHRAGGVRRARRADHGARRRSPACRR